MNGWVNYKKMWVFLICVFALGFVYYFWGSGNSGASESGLGTVTRGSLVQRVTIAGTVEPSRMTLISAPYNGYVKKIYVKIGDQVKAGDPLVSFTQTLHSSDASYPIRAPFSGIIAQIEKSEGEFVRESEAKDYILRVDDLSKIFIKASVPEIDRLKVKIGQAAVIKASAILDRSYKGELKEIYLSAKEKDNWQKSQVDFPLRVEVSDADGQLRPGMSVLVDVIAQKLDNVLQLRHEYILKEEDHYSAILKNGKKVHLQLGVQNEEAFEIKSGLNEGDQVRVVDFASLVKGE